MGIIVLVYISMYLTESFILAMWRSLVRRCGASILQRVRVRVEPMEQTVESVGRTTAFVATLNCLGKSLKCFYFVRKQLITTTLLLLITHSIVVNLQH